MAKGRIGHTFVSVAAESDTSSTADGDASTPRGGGWLGRLLTGDLTRDLLDEAERPVVAVLSVNR